MAKQNTLDVYLNELRVGELVLSTSGAMTFSYDEVYISNENSIPISLSLSLHRKVYKGNAVYNYFDNLLPDGKEMRRRLAQNTGAVSDRPFDLLNSIGADCVGALRFLSKGQNPEESSIRGTFMSSKKIGDLLKNLKAFPLGLHRDQDFRISLAGNQEKAALLFHDGKWKLPIGSTPTTHIFKKPMGVVHQGIDLRTSVENEWLCLKICKHFGLNVNHAEIRVFSGQKCLVAERFDRKWKGKSDLSRIPQEDFCQALGIASHMKYESDHRNTKGPRPGTKDILKLLNASDDRQGDRYHFFKAQILFWLLAAIDGHGKNFSLFITSKGFKMAPLYDILSAYPAIHANELRQREAKLAMAIGDRRHYRLNEILPRHYYQSAKKYGIPRIKVDQMFEEISKASKTLRGKVLRPKKFPNSIYDSITSGFLNKIQQHIG